MTQEALQLLSTSRDRLAEKRREWRGSLPARLYHYTGAAGLQGILSSSRMWATHFRFMNDPIELEYAEGLFRAVVEARLAAESHPDARACLEKLSQSPSVGDAQLFIACFCMHDDLLSQWRGYSDGAQGYALELAIEWSVDHRWGSGLRDEHRYEILRVEYDEDRQRERLTELLSIALEPLRTQALSSDARTGAVAETCGLIRENALPLLASFKQSGFKEEAEWRICQWVDVMEDRFDLLEREHEEWEEVLAQNPAPEDLMRRLVDARPGRKESRVQFRAGPYGPTPYVILDLSPQAGNHANRLPLSAVRYGPTLHKKSVEAGLKLLLRAHDYTVPISASTIQVR